MFIKIWLIFPYPNWATLLQSLSKGKNKIQRLTKSFDREAVNFSHVNISLLPKLAARLSLFVTHVRTLKVSHPPEGGGRFDGGDR